MEAGRARLKGESLRDTTPSEVKELRADPPEGTGGRPGAADPAFEKNPESVVRGWHRKMDGVMKGGLIEKVESQRGRRSEIEQELKIPLE